ncbi:MAG TPA: peptidoglycan recognition family protein [Hyphomicrobiaceae bacterium]|nr:peptidoglycan recognition family protein [Hyphomicrobiaceae bacterium]
MRAKLYRCSAVLSAIVMVMAGLIASGLAYLETRARWSGAPAPEVWRTQAKADDLLQIPGHEIAYWGDPGARYSKYATKAKRAPLAIVVHHTAVKPVQNLVSYGHQTDANRGGASFGYHFYIGRQGSIVQGAPLSRRTNHIKSKNHSNRTGVAAQLWSGNTISVSMIGGCDPMLRPDWNAWDRCRKEFLTRRQVDAGLAVIKAIREKYSLPCGEVYGHGDLQTDRQSFEGVTLSRLARQACIQSPAPGPTSAQPPSKQQTASGS